MHWDGCSAANATWEPVADFKERYPAFQLANELFVGEEGNVMDSFIGQQYRCRVKKATARFTASSG